MQEFKYKRDQRVRWIGHPYRGSDIYVIITTCISDPGATENMYLLEEGYPRLIPGHRVYAPESELREVIRYDR